MIRNISNRPEVGIQQLFDLYKDVRRTSGVDLQVHIPLNIYFGVARYCDLLEDLKKTGVEIGVVVPESEVQNG